MFDGALINADQLSSQSSPIVMLPNIVQPSLPHLLL